MQDIAADFIINNNPGFEFSAQITPPEHFDCSFEINVTPDISHLATKEELQETAELINERVDSVVNDVAEIETELERKVETVNGSELINVNRIGSEITITSTTFVFEQAIASDEWVIEHNLNKIPSVSVFDSADTQISIFEIKNESLNKIILLFNSAFTGVAYLN